MRNFIYILAKKPLEGSVEDMDRIVLRKLNRDIGAFASEYKACHGLLDNELTLMDLWAKYDFCININRKKRTIEKSPVLDIEKFYKEELESLKDNLKYYNSYYYDDKKRKKYNKEVLRLTYSLLGYKETREEYFVIYDEETKEIKDAYYSPSLFFRNLKDKKYYIVGLWDYECEEAYV